LFNLAEIYYVDALWVSRGCEIVEYVGLCFMGIVIKAQNN